MWSIITGGLKLLVVFSTGWTVFRFSLKGIDTLMSWPSSRGTFEFNSYRGGKSECAVPREQHKI